MHPRSLLNTCRRIGLYAGESACVQENPWVGRLTGDRGACRRGYNETLLSVIRGDLAVPGADAGPAQSMIRIARLETFADQFVCFVRLTTDTGDVGWGQTSTYNADITARIFHRQVAPWALGADARDIGALVERIEEREHKFPGSYRCRALAGLD